MPYVSAKHTEADNARYGTSSTDNATTSHINSACAEGGELVPSSGAIPKDNNINRLSNLSKISNIFLDSVETMFRYGAVDVQECINKAEMDTLSNIHQMLCEKVVSIYQDLKGKRTVNRIQKHKIVQDVYNIGYSEVNKQKHKDLHKIFSDIPDKVDNTSDHTDTCLNDILTLATARQTRVAILEAEVQKLRSSVNTLPASTVQDAAQNSCL